MVNEIIMNYQPIITKKSIIFDLEKPIYGSHYGIWDKWLKIAKRKNLNIVVNTKFGTSTYKYKNYIDGAVLKKRFYKNPDEPMRFWCRDFLPDIKARDKRKKAEKKANQEFTLSGRAKMLEVWKKIKK